MQPGTFFGALVTESSCLAEIVGGGASLPLCFLPSAPYDWVTVNLQDGCCLPRWITALVVLLPTDFGCEDGAESSTSLSGWCVQSKGFSLPERGTSFAVTTLLRLWSSAPLFINDLDGAGTSVGFTFRFCFISTSFFPFQNNEKQPKERNEKYHRMAASQRSDTRVDSGQYTGGIGMRS